MTKQRKPTGGGGKLTRSETVTVRLDPKLRYLAELAARKQRRTLSSFIEWAIEDNLCRILMREGKGHNNDHGISIADAAPALWDIDEADRFAKLALNYPDLLTHDEQVLWKLICENGYLWRGQYDKYSKEWTWRVNKTGLMYQRLRECWNDFVAVAKGKASKDRLPAWIKMKPS
jgi:hypothetical protein